MPSSVGTLFVLLALVFWLGRQPGSGVPSVRGVPLSAIILASTAAAAFITVPVWYALRGALQDFWEQWWTYNQIYSEATGRSLVGQLSKGRLQLAGYYRRYPIYSIGVLTFIIDTGLRWRGLSALERPLLLRTSRVVACRVFLQLAVFQRYFPHSSCYRSFQRR